MARSAKLWGTTALQAWKEFCMNAKHNVNKNVHQLDAQITELGAATELTLGFGGCETEGRDGWQRRFRMKSPRETSKQVTELGAATKLTLGYGGNSVEGMKSYIKKMIC
jgi:hypothetical protein